MISKRYEQGSIIITTNKLFDQWKDIFDDTVLAEAIKDRLIHHALLFQIKGKSYRTSIIKK